MTREWDVVIIGGGLAGLVAANYLALKRLSVLVMEKSNQLGGRAGTKIVDQQYFNLGPHALYKTGSAKAILEELGVQLKGKSPKLGGSLIEDDKQYLAPFTPFGVLTTRLLHWKERIEWVRVLMKLKRVDTALLHEQTFKAWVEKMAISKSVQNLLFLLGRLATYCNKPEMTSAQVIVGHLKNVMRGVIYLDGGWQSIIDQLHQRAEANGVEFYTRTPLKQIDQVDQDKIKLLTTNNDRIIGNYILYSGSPFNLSHLVGDKDSAPAILRQCKPVKGATLDVALSELPKPKKLFSLGITTPIYYSVHSPYAKLSDSGKSAILHVFKYLEPDQLVDSRSTRVELEDFLERVQPGWREKVITARFLPNIIVNQRLPIVGDDLSHKMGISNIFLAGDWADPDFILSDGAAASGKRAAEEIIRMEKRSLHGNNERGLQAI